MKKQLDHTVIVVRHGIIENESTAVFEIVATVIAVALALTITVAIAVLINGVMAIIFLSLFVAAFVWCTAGGL